MPENEDDFRTGLRKTGQWEAFCLRRKELLAQGESKRHSWEEAAREFGWKGRTPGEDGPVATQRTPEVAPADFKGKPPSTPTQDTLWVYQSMVLDDVTPQDAPSCAAWGLLLWARKNKDFFYRQRILPIAEWEGPPDTEEEEDEESESPLLKLFEKFMNEDNGNGNGCKNAATTRQEPQKTSEEEG